MYNSGFARELLDLASIPDYFWGRHPGDQFLEMIVEPLKKSPIDEYTLVVIEGLDQCKYQEMVVDFLSALDRSISMDSTIKFLICTSNLLTGIVEESFQKLDNRMRK